MPLNRHWSSGSSIQCTIGELVKSAAAAEAAAAVEKSPASKAPGTVPHGLYAKHQSRDEPATHHFLISQACCGIRKMMPVLCFCWV